MTEVIFKDFSFEKERKELFLILREVVDKSISDRMLAVIICCKKKYEKCVASAKKVKGVHDKHGFGVKKLNEKMVSGYLEGCFHFDPSIKTKEGYHFLALRVKNIVFLDATYEEKVNLFIYNFQTILRDFPLISTKGLCVVLDLTGLGFSNVDYKLVKAYQSLLKLLPIRPQKIFMFNAPWYFKILLAIVKPFMSKKIFGRINTSDAKKILDEVDEKALPTFLGGKLVFDLEKMILDVYCKGDKKMFEKLKGKKKVTVVDVMEENVDKDLDESEKKRLEEEFLKKVKEVEANKK